MAARVTERLWEIGDYLGGKPWNGSARNYYRNLDYLLVYLALR
jgi:hypothetical protein